MSQKSRIPLGVIVDVHLGNLIHVATSYRELDKTAQLKDEEGGNTSIFLCVLKPSGKYTCQVSNAWLQALSQPLQTHSQSLQFLICEIRLQSAPFLTQGLGMSNTAMICWSTL